MRLINSQIVECNLSYLKGGRGGEGRKEKEGEGSEGGTRRRGKEGRGRRGK